MTYSILRIELSVNQIIRIYICGNTAHFITIFYIMTHSIVGTFL